MMDQLLLQWKNMNKEIIKEELLKFGNLIQDKDYFLKLGNRLSNLYLNNFKSKKNNILYTIYLIPLNWQLLLKTQKKHNYIIKH